MTALRTALFAALLLAIIGCGNNPTPAKVKGTVTYKGQPLPGGTMTFAFDTGGGYSTAIQSDGAYSAVDLPLGNVVVSIETESFNPDKSNTPSYGDPKSKNSGGKKVGSGTKVPPGGEDGMRKMRMEQEGVAPGGGKGGFGPASPEDLAKLYVKIPTKYNNKLTSGLRMEIVRGLNEKNFELTD